MSYCQRCADLEKELLQSKNAAHELERRVEELQAAFDKAGDGPHLHLSCQRRERDLESRLAQAQAHKEAAYRNWNEVIRERDKAEAAAAAMREALEKIAQTEEMLGIIHKGPTVEQTGPVQMPKLSNFKMVEIAKAALSHEAGREKE